MSRRLTSNKSILPHFDDEKGFFMRGHRHKTTATNNRCSRRYRVMPKEGANNAKRQHDETNNKKRFFITRKRLFQRKIVTSYIPCRWRTASKRRMAALTETFRESSLPSMGIRIWASAASRHCEVRPVDSVPITMAVGAVMSVA